MEKLKVAIVYDWLDKWGGAERLLLALKKLFPQAVFFTSYRDCEKTKWLGDSKVRESFLAKLPNFVKKNRILSLPFMPFVFESFDFSKFDLVVSLTAYFAKSVITKPSTLHISYILTPPRFLYYDSGEYLSSFTRRLLRPYLSYLKKWDWIAAQRADVVLSISQEVKKRVKEVYKRNSDVIYPSFDGAHWKSVQKNITKSQSINKFEQIMDKRFFLYVGRLEPYKKVNLFVGLAKYFPNYYFVVVGKGSLEKKLMSLAGKNVFFLKDLSDEELGFLYSKALALIMPQKEEFGYVALESLFFSLPVIYFSEGGAKEILGELGVSFEKQTVNSLKGAVEKFLTLSYNLRNRIKRKKKKVLEKFSEERFKREFESLLKRYLK